MEFVLGQRWVSQTESELGLGMVVDIEGRHVTVQFPAAEEDRVYALNNSPLARVIYEAGETLFDQEQTPFTVKSVEDLDGLKCYFVYDADGGERMLPETQISGLVHLSSPNQRLLSGQFDKAAEYQLRVASLHARYNLQRSEARGLLGSRTSLLAHQVYIAQEVASRFAPRVLLADEVGLGKTIEAGMILHHQLQSGLARRVLIVVPDALLHQWLVEMLRKFGLRFSLFDQDRYDALLEAGEVNPFESEQLVLCGLSLVSNDERLVDQACEADWDLLVVDEAHHLFWTPDQASDEYTAVEQLARVSAGLLLLTATPEQLGVESHFARLRLLDPQRFSDFTQFTHEQAKYVELNDIVSALKDGVELTSTQSELLDSFAGLPEPSSVSTDDLISQLLDQHGTGRVLFRNTRAAISGFPERHVTGYRLDVDDDFPFRDVYAHLTPESELRAVGLDWVQHDPRVVWLENFFKMHKQSKVLLICADAETAIDLEKHLHLDVGIRSAAFYEGLSILERDRAAAYFADEEAGAQTLICSEIGSEGRNFQFAHHLVLFDLPTNPDLLEQRIGRLDRIGQTSDIEIHVPYVAHSAQEVLFRWYQEGLDAFCHSFSGGTAVSSQFGEELGHVLRSGLDDEQKFTALLEQAASFTQALRIELQQGRDQLLELNSCKPEIAAGVIEKIEAAEASDDLKDFVTLACDTFGVEPEYHSEHSLVLKPTEHMFTHAFPEVGDDGLTVTFDRSKAIVREDMEFLTWESPVIDGVMEMVLGSELGNTSISTISLKALPAGTLLVECYFVMRASAPKRYQLGRFLPETPIRMLLDSSDRNLTEVVNHEALAKLCQHIKKSTRTAIIKEIRTPLAELLEKAHQTAIEQEETLKRAARQRVEDIVGHEIERLRQLQSINPSIRSEEIDFFVTQRKEVLAHIEQASLEPQAARVVIAT
ncbi:MAG: RNA polymerase-associated protein RapA [Pseudomonadales bacterium]|nr:RNA polymerase-associated protein RapA [Pseudomonadales bacterium]